MMDYQAAWEFLNNLQFFKIKLGLDSMSAFLESLGRPQDDLAFIHIAGTNGKGSVSANILTILQKAGYRVGLYTSPHLSSVRERFRIGSSFITEDEFAAQATRISRSLAGRQITYFEFTTALALLWFAEQGVDLAIMEVGLGGRLDATNVISPMVSVITNVSMDHEAYLGNTLPEVAGEKAGIIKAGIPLITGVANNPARTVIEKRAAELAAPLFLLGRDFKVEPGPDKSFTYRGRTAEWLLADLSCGMAGSYQTSNSAVALAVLEILSDLGFPVGPESIRTALPQVNWPGRLEQFCLSEPAGKPLAESEIPPLKPEEFRRYLLDGAHNPAGVRCLAEFLKDTAVNRQIVMIWASMSDKKYHPSLALIAPLCQRLIFTRPEAERSARPEELIQETPKKYQTRCLTAENPQIALDMAIKASDGQDLICAAGSLYLIGAVRTILLGEIIK